MTHKKNNWTLLHEHGVHVPFFIMTDFCGKNNSLAERFGCKSICFKPSKIGAESENDQNWLVVSTHLKHISQIGSFPQIGLKIKDIWNHHLENDQKNVTTQKLNLQFTPGPMDGCLED